MLDSLTRTVRDMTDPTHKDPGTPQPVPKHLESLMALVLWTATWGPFRPRDL